MQLHNFAKSTCRMCHISQTSDILQHSMSRLLFTMITILWQVHVSCILTCCKGNDIQTVTFMIYSLDWFACYVHNKLLHTRVWHTWKSQKKAKLLLVASFRQCHTLFSKNPLCLWQGSIFGAEAMILLCLVMQKAVVQLWHVWCRWTERNTCWSVMWLVMKCPVHLNCGACCIWFFLCFVWSSLLSLPCCWCAL